MPNIFICYRRNDSGANVSDLHPRLCRAFGADQVFMDLKDIARGDDFAARIQRRVESSDVMLVVIGQLWADVQDAQGRRRLLHPDDLVRREVEAGLERRLRVIPVLVNGMVSMPPKDKLPPSLQRLCSLNSHEISLSRVEFDTDRLIVDLGGTPAGAASGSDFWDKLAGSFADTLGKRLGDRLLPAAQGTPSAPAAFAPASLAPPLPAQRDLSGHWHALNANARHRITQRGQQIVDELLNPFGMVVGRAQGALMGDQIHLNYVAPTPMGPVHGEVHATVSDDGSVIRGMAFDPVHGRQPVEMRRL